MGCISHTCIGCGEVWINNECYSYCPRCGNLTHDLSDESPPCYDDKEEEEDEDNN